MSKEPLKNNFRARRNRTEDPVFPLPSLVLRYQKETVVAVRSAFKEWRREVQKMPLAKRRAINDEMKKKWRLLDPRSRSKSYINPSRDATDDQEANDAERCWFQVSENLFDAMVAALEHFKALTVLDDGRLVRGIEDHLHHSLVGLLDGPAADRSPRRIDGKLKHDDNSPRLLVGRYKVYQPSTTARNSVLLGVLTVQADRATTVKTTFEQRVPHEKQPVKLHGTIVRFERTRCLWVDRGPTTMRFNRLNTSPYIGPNGEETVDRLYGWSYMCRVSGDESYVRKMILERVTDNAEKLTSQVLKLSDSAVPEEYRVHLSSRRNSTPLDPFSIIAAGGGRER